MGQIREREKIEKRERMGKMCNKKTAERLRTFVLRRGEGSTDRGR